MNLNEIRKWSDEIKTEPFKTEKTPRKSAIPKIRQMLVGSGNTIMFAILLIGAWAIVAPGTAYLWLATNFNAVMFFSIIISSAFECFVTVLRNYNNLCGYLGVFVTLTGFLILLDMEMMTPLVFAYIVAGIAIGRVVFNLLDSHSEGNVC